jgi:hypothetical protein
MDMQSQQAYVLMIPFTVLGSSAELQVDHRWNEFVDDAPERKHFPLAGQV